MFAKSINNTSRVIRMMIVGDATTWSIIIESSFTILMLIIQTTGLQTAFFFKIYLLPQFLSYRDVIYLFGNLRTLAKKIGSIFLILG